MNYRFDLNADGTVKSAFWRCCNENITFYTQQKTGEGVFMHTPTGEKQLTGTGQFSIYGLKKDSARSKIKKWMIDNGYGWKYENIP